MMLETLRKFLNFQHFEAADTIPIIVKQPALFVGNSDTLKKFKSWSFNVVYGHEQRIEFVVDFLNARTFNKYYSSMFLEVETHPDTIATVDLVSYGTKIEGENCVYTEQISSENFRYTQGVHSPTNPCIDYFRVKNGNRNRVIISLLSTNIPGFPSAYSFMLKQENKNKAWQFMFTLKDNINPNRPKPCVIRTQVFKFDTSSSKPRFILIEKAKSK